MLSALEETRLLVVEFKLEVLGYAAKDLPLRFAVSKLIVPGLVDQLNSMKNAVLPNLLAEHPLVINDTCGSTLFYVVTDK